MEDVTISATATLAYGLWAVGITFVVVQLFDGAPLGQLGLLAAGAGMVLNVRGFICTQCQREQSAFDLGRESVRAVK
jgi:hypothetical protein